MSVNAANAGSSKDANADRHGESNRLVAKNFMALGSGEALARLVTFAGTVYLARVLGAEGYGVVAFALNINLYLTVIADFGIEALGTKEVAADRAAIATKAPPLMSARIVFGGVLALLSAIIVVFTFPEPERTVLPLYFLALIPIAASTKWIHLGMENARPVGLARVTGEALALALIVAVVRDLDQIPAVPLAAVVGESTAAGMLWFLLAKTGHALRLRWAPREAIPLFRRAAPLVGHIVLGLVIYNSGLVFLFFLRGREDVGHYAAAYNLISFLLNLGGAYGMSLLPTLTRLGARSRGETELYHTALAQVFAVCLPMAIGGSILAGPIIHLVFGPAYQPAGPALAILLWSVPASIYRNVAWSALVAREKQNLLFRTTVWATLVELILNVLLIPEYGIPGASVATLITECVRTWLALRYASGEELRFLALRRLSKPALAGVVMGGVLLATGIQNIFIGIPLGVVLYAGVLFATGGIRFGGGRLPSLSV